MKPLLDGDSAFWTSAYQKSSKSHNHVAVALIISTWAYSCLGGIFH